MPSYLISLVTTRFSGRVMSCCVLTSMDVEKKSSGTCWFAACAIILFVFHYFTSSYQKVSLGSYTEILVWLLVCGGNRFVASLLSVASQGKEAKTAQHGSICSWQQRWWRGPCLSALCHFSEITSVKASTSKPFSMPPSTAPTNLI